MNSVKTGARLAAEIRALKDSASLGMQFVSTEQLEEWASAINPTGFIVSGLNAKQLVEHLSRAGELTNMMTEACAMYGFDLHIDEDVATRLNAKSTTGHRDLLTKYARYLNDTEGTTFLYNYCGGIGDQKFTDAEWAELQRVHAEVMS